MIFPTEDGLIELTPEVEMIILNAEKVFDEAQAILKKLYYEHLK
jgi:hypothetical protein